MTSDGASSVAGDEARIVIVGGGVGGLSTLYHLARRGIDDVLLLEQHELTSGTTWHAAGLCTQYSTSSTLMRALRASVELYRELEADTGQAVGFHPTGSLRLAPTHDHMDELRHVQGVAEVAGLPYALIDPEEARARFPLLDPAGIEGAAWLPTDGWIDPSSLAAAYARGARQRGARIRTGVRVTGLERRDGTWRIATSDGEVRAQTLVCAAGLWARELLGLAGARLPLVALPHHYVFTEPVPGLAAGGDELPVLRDPSARFYARQDNDGLIVGPFEQALEPWALDGVPRGWSRRLIKPDMRRILPALEAAAERIPLLGELGVKKALNGPDGYTPDGRCLMGPVPGLRDAYVLAGFSIFGIVWSGGAGLRMAEWLADGQPVDSMWELDVRRFGDHAGVAYTGRRAVQVYVREYDVHRPEEEWPAGRPLKTDPLYDRLTARGAVWASRNGWERPAFFAAPGEPQEDAPAFRRADAPWHEAVLREARAVRTAVGVLDQTSFGKYVVRGAGAEALLDRLSPNRLPGEIGRMALLQLLTERGGIECDLSATRIGPDAFYVVSAAGTAPHDLDWLRRHAPEDGSVEIEDVTSRYGVLTLAGPRSRELVGRLTRADVSREAFPFFSCRDLELAMAPVRAFRVSYVGEPRLRAARPDRVPAPPRRGDPGGRRGPRARRLRLPRARRDAAREGLPALGRRHVGGLDALRGRPRPLRPPRQGPVHRPRRAAPPARGGRPAPARAARGRRRGRGRARPRARLPAGAERRDRVRRRRRLRADRRALARPRLPARGACAGGHRARAADPRRAAPRRRRAGRAPRPDARAAAGLARHHDQWRRRPRPRRRRAPAAPSRRRARPPSRRASRGSPAT